MNLLCPSCQKQLQVGEQYAGQMMKCPLCSATFTVPVLPQMPAAVSPPPVPPLGAGSPHISAAAPPKPGDLAAPSAGPYARGLTINPRLIAWLAPVCLLLIFVCLFFTWNGMFPGGVGVVTQSGWQTAFGSTS